MIGGIKAWWKGTALLSDRCLAYTTFEGGWWVDCREYNLTCQEVIDLNNAFAVCALTRRFYCVWDPIVGWRGVIGLLDFLNQELQKQLDKHAIIFIR